ncbi:MAG: helix-turn-helix domain-containing protein [Demequinaceae bacterium]|nr:helix-turn-helix domain-containing protein [Demequinaceae bacterium]
MENREGVGPSPSRFDPERSPLSPARAKVLEALQRSGATVSAADVARELGLHENTARKHLEGLAERLLVQRIPGEVSGRGRPALSYRALPQHAEPDARVREYVGLAGALARHIGATSANPEADAIAVGERWGAELAAADPAALKRPIEIHIIKAFDEMGFAPELDEEGDSVALTRCPLIDAVHAEPTIVCGVHFGVARGLMRAHGADVSRARLSPFSEVGACRLHLR